MHHTIVLIQNETPCQGITNLPTLGDCSFHYYVSSSTNMRLDLGANIKGNDTAEGSCKTNDQMPMDSTLLQSLT